MKATKLFKRFAGISAVFALFFASTTFAADVTLQDIQGNIDTAVVTVASILTDIALVTGICFILAAFFKFHQHKVNPNQTPISQGVTLLVIGAALTAFTVLIPVATQSIYGKGQAIMKTGGADMKTLIDGGNAK
jgi:intracellular multiplication protein IcmD